MEGRLWGPLLLYRLCNGFRAVTEGSGFTGYFVTRPKLKPADALTCCPALHAIRIDAFAADGFVAQRWRCALVAFSPFMKSTSPFRIGSRKVRDGARLRLNMLPGDLFDHCSIPLFNRQPTACRLGVRRR
jgi:hypothetical protein